MLCVTFVLSVTINRQAPLELLSIFSFALLIFGACRWNWIFVSILMDCRIRNIYFLLCYSVWCCLALIGSSWKTRLLLWLFEGVSFLV